MVNNLDQAKNLVKEMKDSSKEKIDEVKKENNKVSFKLESKNNKKKPLYFLKKSKNGKN